MKKLIGLAAVAVVLLACQSLIMAQGCTSIAQPTAAYQAMTNKCTLPPPITSTTDCSIGGTFVARTFETFQTREVPGSWGTWSSPPEAESSTPRLGFVQGTTATFWIVTPANTVGVEVENNVFEPAMPVTVQFYSLDADTA